MVLVRRTIGPGPASKTDLLSEDFKRGLDQQTQRLDWIDIEMV